MTPGKLLLIYICNFHVLSNLLFNYICKLHWIRSPVSPGGNLYHNWRSAVRADDDRGRIASRRNFSTSKRKARSQTTAYTRWPFSPLYTSIVLDNSSLFLFFVCVCVCVCLEEEYQFASVFYDNDTADVLDEEKNTHRLSAEKAEPEDCPDEKLKIDESLTRHSSFIGHRDK